MRGAGAQGRARGRGRGQGAWQGRRQGAGQGQRQGAGGQGAEQGHGAGQGVWQGQGAGQGCEGGNPYGGVCIGERGRATAGLGVKETHHHKRQQSLPGNGSQCSPRYAGSTRLPCLRGSPVAGPIVATPTSTGAVMGHIALVSARRTLRVLVELGRRSSAGSSVYAAYASDQLDGRFEHNGRLVASGLGVGLGVGV